jgi:uncharacterized protein (DUF58 family)
MLIRRLILLFLFILSLVAISNFGGVVSYTLFYATLLIPLLSLIYLFFVYNFFAVYQEIKTRNIVAGEQIPYSFILSNQWFSVFTAVAVRFYTNYSYVNEVVGDEALILFPRDRVAFETSLVCKYRGEYKVGVEKLLITDFLGLFRAVYRMPSAIEAIVKPRIVYLEDLRDVPELEEFLQSHLKLEINEMDLLVRDYQSGDSLKKLHWKATARSGEFKVRNEIGMLKQKVLLLADFERKAKKAEQYLPLENQILEQTIALLYYFVRQNIPLEMVFSATDTEKLESRSVSSLPQFYHLYEELASIHFREENSFPLLYQTAEDSGLLAQIPLIFLVIQHLSEELYAKLATLSATGKLIIVYVVTHEVAASLENFIRQSNVRLKIIKVGVEI